MLPILYMTLSLFQENYDVMTTLVGELRGRISNIVQGKFPYLSNCLQGFVSLFFRTPKTSFETLKLLNILV